MFGVLALRKHSDYSKSLKITSKEILELMIIRMTLSMFWMRALPQNSQHPRSYKVASEVILELMVHLGVIFDVLDACSAIACPIFNIL